MQTVGELQVSVALDAPLHEKEHTSVPPRPVSVSDGSFTFGSQLLQTFPQLQHSQLLNITRHKEIYLELAGAPIHYGTDVRTGRDILIYDVSLTCGGVDITTIEFLNLLDQLCCYISLTTPPQQLDPSRPYGPQIRTIVATVAELSTCTFDTQESAPSLGAVPKDTAESCIAPKLDQYLSSAPSTATGHTLPIGPQSNAVDFTHTISSYTEPAKDAPSDHETVEGFLTYIKPGNTAELQRSIQIKFFPKIFSKYFIKVLQAYINPREKKLIIITENFQGLFLPSLFIKIKTNSQGTRRLHDSLVHKYCCNLLDSLLYISQHKISLKSLDPRCLAVDTQQCILRLFPSAFLLSVTRADEMIYRHPSELYMSFFTGLGISPRDFFWHKTYIGQALAYWLSKYNEFLNLEKNSRLSNPSIDHRQREYRDSQSISQENINGLFYHIYSENFDDVEEYPSYLSLSVGYRTAGDAPADAQGAGAPQGAGASSPSSGRLAWSGSNETVSCADAIKGPTALDQADRVYRGTSIPNFLAVDKLPIGSASIASLDTNTRAKQTAPGSTHTCTTSFNCPCILYLFMKRLLVLSNIYMPLFLKHLTATIKEQFEADFSYFPRHTTLSPRDTRLFKLLTDFVGFPIENPWFQENEKTEYVYIVSPHCSKCCRVLRGMIARFRPINELALASLDGGSQGYASYSKIPSGQQHRMERSASGSLPHIPASYHGSGLPLDDGIVDGIGPQFAKSNPTGKHLNKHRPSKVADRTDTTIANGSDFDGHVGSSAVTNAKSPQDCDYEQEIAPTSHVQLTPFARASPEAKFMYSIGKSKDGAALKDLGEHHDRMVLVGDHQTTYDTGGAMLDLCVSSPNVSQELSESLEADVVQGHGDDVDDFGMIDFGMIRPAAIRHIYSLGLVMLCVATGADPWTQEGYLIDGLLNDKLPISLIDLQNRDLCDLITKCIDGSNFFGSIEALLEHKYFKEHLDILQHQQQRDSVSSRDHLVHAALYERENAATKAGANPFKMLHGHAKEDELLSVNPSAAVLVADPTSEQSSVGRLSVTDSALHTEGSATDCPSEQEGSELKPTGSKIVPVDGHPVRGPAGTSADAVKTLDTSTTRDGCVTPSGPLPHCQVMSSLATGVMPPHAQVVTPNSVQSSTPINTNEHTCTDDSLPTLSQQTSESKLPCFPLEPTTLSNLPTYPRYKRVELLTLRRDTATLAVIYSIDSNTEKKITHSISNDEEPANIYLEVLKKMESEQLVLAQAEPLESDIDDLLKRKFYQQAD